MPSELLEVRRNRSEGRFTYSCASVTCCITLALIPKRKLRFLGHQISWVS